MNMSSGDTRKQQSTIVHIDFQKKNIPVWIKMLKHNLALHERLYMRI